MNALTDVESWVQEAPEVEMTVIVTMKIKVLLLFVFCGLIFHNADGQLKASYIISSSKYTIINDINNVGNIGNKIGVGYDINKMLTVDAYFYSSHNDFEEFSPELTVRANFLSKDAYKLYAGAGMFVGRQISLVFPVGVEIKPFNSSPRLSFRFDINTVIGLDINPSYLVPGFGISYSFGK